MSALDGRRQTALEAYLDAGGSTTDRVGEAIETATRVRVKGDVYEAGFQAYDASGLTHSGAIMEAITAAFEAAGFEVEQ